MHTDQPAVHAGTRAYCHFAELSELEVRSALAPLAREEWQDALVRILYLTWQNPGIPGGAGARMASEIAALSLVGEVQVIVVAEHELVDVGAAYPISLVRPDRTGLISRVIVELLTFVGLIPHNVNVVAAIRTRRRISSAVAGRPDVIWCYGLPVFFMVPGAMRRAAVVYTDVVDFEGERDREMVDMAKHRLVALRRVLRKRSIPALRRAARFAVRKSTRCVISSETDRAALGEPGVEVLPNTSGPFQPALNRSLVAPVPTFLFVGTLV